MVVCRGIVQRLVSRVRAAWTSAKDADGFQLLDVLKPLRVSFERPARTWQRPIWYTTHALAVWQYGKELVNVVNALAYSHSTSVRAWYATLTTGMTVVLAANLILRHYAKSIQQVRDFIESRFTFSGDTSYDTGERNALARRSRISAWAMLIALMMDQILFSIPNAERHKYFIDPLNRSLESAESHFQRTANYIFLDTFAIVWMSKYFWAFGTLTILLLGLRSEQRILAHRFENDLQRMKSRLTMENFDSPHHFYRWKARDTFWKQLKADVQLTLEQHLELIRNIQLLQPSIGSVFLFFYIYAIIGIGSVIFLVMDERMSLVSVVLVITIVAVVIQGFGWCWLIETFQDMNENIHETVYEMCALLPYDAEHCSSYRQMRSSLMTIAVYSANGDKFSCVGISDITVDLFAKILDVSYDTLKFLKGFRQ